MRVVGIDPGLDGAIVLLTDGSFVDEESGYRLIECDDMPTVEVRGKRRVDANVLTGILARHQLTAELFAIEDVQGVQGSGATSAFSFGRGVGIIDGIVAALMLPSVRIRPQEWTKNYGGSDKGAHLQAAKRLWPEHAATTFACGPRGGKGKDGRADAALIAYHASQR